MQAPPLRLQIGPRLVSFDTLDDFEFNLSSRTQLPAAKVAELMVRPAENLSRQARDIRRLEKRFAEILASSLTHGERLGALMAELDVKIFSQDHDWRSIMAALREQGPEFDEYRRVALAKYMQYLGSRFEILKGIYLEKRQSEPEPDERQEAEVIPDPALRETGIFEVSRLRGSPPASPGIVRLPRGEGVTVRLGDRDDLDLRLAKHAFRLLQGDSLVLVDDRGRRYPLHPGTNLIGRQADNDIVVDPAYRDVSRKHLVIEPLPEHRARLTDLSSHGTFVPGRRLEKQLNHA